MPEKLYKVIKAVDLFEEGDLMPERYLVFMDSEGDQTKEFFPKDRATLFFQGELYDWYGHKVVLSNEITKVLKPFGYSHDSRDQFLVITKNHRYALATLHYEKADKLPRNRNHNPSTPILKCRNWTFEKLANISSTCLDEYFGNSNKCSVFVGANNNSNDNTNSSSSYIPYFIKPEESILNLSCTFFMQGPTYQYPLRHKVFIDREKAVIQLCHPHKEIHWRDDAVTMANYLLGDLQISKHSGKISAIFPVPSQTGNTRISTDSGIIQHGIMNHECLYWYYDPKP